MKFALIDNIKTEATRGAKGICPSCGSNLIAKCGEVKVHHWAHKGTRNCDPWWENETEWHRSWKDNFSSDWQEIILTDEITGEKHIADIRTTEGLVIEFQHSHLDPVERRKRENFYKIMIWVVDGARLKRDYPRFLKKMGEFRVTNKPGIYQVDFPQECFPPSWLESSVPVIFDFRGTEEISNPRDLRNHLFYLFPKAGRRESILAIVSRESFINNVISGEFFKQQPEPIIGKEQRSVRNRAYIPVRESQYIFKRGRWYRRRRF